MSLLAAVLTGIIGMGVVPLVALREGRRLRRARVALLDPSRQLLQPSRITWSGAGYPQLEGRYSGRRVIAALVPDTMTIRRLPQLWLSLTLAVPLPIQAAFAALVRPTGNEFYSLTSSLPDTLPPPPDWPTELLLRARGEEAGSLIARAARPIGRLLTDGRIKEVGVTPRGLRVVWQAAEGALGPHLLLRQADFPARPIPAADLQTLLDQLMALAMALAPDGPGRSAAA